MIRFKNQRGSLLLITIAILSAIMIMGLFIINRTKTNITIAGSEFHYMPLKVCAEQCAGLTVNHAVRMLESNQLLTSKTTDCPCLPGKGPWKNPTCELELELHNNPQSVAKGCYDLTIYRTIISSYSRCIDTDKRKIQLDQRSHLEEIPLFQFAIFYDNKMEIYPAKNFKITGKIHSNDKIEISDGGTKWFSNWVTAVKTITLENSANHYFAKINTPEPDLIQPAKAFNGNKDLLHNHINLQYGDWDDWKKKHRVAYQAEENGCTQVSALKLPIKGNEPPRSLIEDRENTDSDALRRQKYSWIASLTLSAKNNSFKWKDINDNRLHFVDDSIIAPPPYGDSAWDPVSRRIQIYEGHDELTVYLVPINIAQLQSLRPNDSLVYLHDNHHTGPDKTGGFYLYNGQTLVRPLTVATNSRIMVQGDYNVDSTYAPPWLGQPNVQPTSIAADATTILSNQFRPNEFRFPINVKTAPHRPDDTTTYNFCSITGDTRGGVHRLLRQHEDWDDNGASFLFTGSLVCLYEPKVATARVRGYYTIPQRLYEFNTMYDDWRNLPPGTPRVVQPQLIDWKLSRRWSY